MFDQCCVYRGGIALQRHPLVQPVDENRGNQRAFGSRWSLRLYQRRQCDRLMNLRGMRINWKRRPDFAKLRGHHAAQLGSGCVASEPVDGWEQITLQVGGQRVKVVDQARIRGGFEKFFGPNRIEIGEQPSNIEKITAFRDTQFHVVDLATLNLAENLPRRERLIEAILAGL